MTRVATLADGEDGPMIDMRSILGSLIEAGMTPSSSRRIDHALNTREPGGGSLLEQIMAGAGKVAGDTKQQAQAGNPFAVGGLGALAGAILGGAKGSAPRGAIGGAALAILGQIAYQALQGRLPGGMGGGAASGAATAGSQAGDAQPRVTAIAAGEDDLPLGVREPRTPGEEAVLRSRSQILLQAMISAAKADGQIDGREMERILSKLDEAGAEQEAKDFVLAEMRRPLDVDELTSQVEAPDLAAEVYAASLLAIEVDTPAERAYLDRLAGALKLDRSARQHIERVLGVGGTVA
jgi:uncharacterized membrane protein YebE (DUF533 family)